MAWGIERAVRSTSAPTRSEELIACDLPVGTSLESRMTCSELWPWFSGPAEATPHIEDVFCRFCDGLAQCGLPLWRGAFLVEILHPEVSGSSLVWTEEEGVIVAREAERTGFRQSESYLNSPAR